MNATVDLTLPKFWLLVMPCGCIDGSMVSVSMNWSIFAATADDAWKKFTPTKRARDREARDGWTCRGITEDELEHHVALLLAKCPHSG